MLTVIPSLTPAFVAELNFLAHYDLDTMQEGFKVHKDADPEVIASAQRLFDKKLITLPDGGYDRGPVIDSHTLITQLDGPIDVALSLFGRVGVTKFCNKNGGAPGTRETDAMHPLHLVERVHAVTLAGGSAFGLDAAAGVMR